MLPATFGTTRTDVGVRVVWHYQALDERRTFTIGYRLSGIAVAYDDVVDVNLQVWGSEWEVGLAQADRRGDPPGGGVGARVQGLRPSGLGARRRHPAPAAGGAAGAGRASEAVRGAAGGVPALAPHVDGRCKGR